MQLQFKTKCQFMQELGLSKSTFYRLLKKNDIPTTPELLSPHSENELRMRLGFPPIPALNAPDGTHWNGLGHIGTDTYQKRVGSFVLQLFRRLL